MPWLVEPEEPTDGAWLVLRSSSGSSRSSCLSRLLRPLAMEDAGAERAEESFCLGGWSESGDFEALVDAEGAERRPERRVSRGEVGIYWGDRSRRGRHGRGKPASLDFGKGASLREQGLQNAHVRQQPPGPPSPILPLITPDPRPISLSLTTMAPAAILEYASNAPNPISYPRLPKHHLLTTTNTPDYLRLILTSKVYEILKETPLVLAANLSAKLGNQIWFKREDLQEVFSFKIRGAYNFMAGLSDEERWKGVVTCSAG